MRAAITVISSDDPSVTLPNKLIAFDNLEQLVESIDNASNLEALSLWTPLVSQLQSQEHELRRMAAWCIGTAVQNNPISQERLLVIGALPTLIRLALDDESSAVRGKAIYALSSAVRNFPPALETLLRELPKEIATPNSDVQAGDMESIGRIIGVLRERSRAKEEAAKFADA
jgi:hypothetical protein